MSFPNGKNIWFYEPEKKTASRMDSLGMSLSVISMILYRLKNPERALTSHSLNRMERITMNLPRTLMIHGKI
jgi:hypothetical protein